MFALILDFRRYKARAAAISDEESRLLDQQLPNPPPYALRPSESVTPQLWCNNLIDRRNSNGSWRIDTSLSVPRTLLPSITEFDGRWNEDVRMLRRNRNPSLSEVRPNLMIVSSEPRGIRGDVLISGQGEAPAFIVAESTFGVDLELNAPQGKGIRISAYSDQGDVKVWIPAWFDGALVVSTSSTDIKMSDGIKAKFTVFSAKPKQIIGYIGDWRTSTFNSAQSSSSTVAPEPVDAFGTSSGPFIKVTAGSGSVSLALLEEKRAMVTKEFFIILFVVSLVALYFLVVNTAT